LATVRGARRVNNAAEVMAIGVTEHPGSRCRMRRTQAAQDVQRRHATRMRRATAHEGLATSTACFMRRRAARLRRAEKHNGQACRQRQAWPLALLPPNACCSNVSSAIRVPIACRR
jgi:hypothetical protein